MSRCGFCWLSSATVLLAGLAAAGCSNQDDGRTVSGRTRSLVSAADPSAAVEGRLRFTTSREQATGEEQARWSASLRVEEAEAAVVRLPSGEELAMTPTDPAGALEVALAGTPAELAARCPAGAYTFLARTRSGAHASLTLVATGAPPPAPAIDAPLDLAVVPADALAVAWTWSGAGGLFDVTLVDAQDAMVYRAQDLAELAHTVPAGALAPGRYRLAVTAGTAAASAAVRFEAESSVLVDVTP